MSGTTCGHCGESEIVHHPGDLACRVYKPKTKKFQHWHPSNRFTPAVRDHIVGVNKMAPAGCAPFDLPKALAGERLVTRDGRPVTGFKSRSLFGSSAFPYQAVIMHHIHYFDPSGRYNGNIESEADLFLAAKGECAHEKCNRCDGTGQLNGNGCARCKGEGVFPPRMLRASPKTEARREGLSLIEFQIQVMRESEKQEVITERCHRGCADDPQAEWSPKLPEERFNWQSYDYRVRIRPASPAPPRRVWINIHSKDEAITAYWSEGAAKEARRYTRNYETVEYINLNQLLAIAPEVRAKLGRGGGV